MSRRLISVFGVAVWENVENFNVDDHVRIEDEDKNKKWTEDEIMEYMSTL